MKKLSKTERAKELCGLRPIATPIDLPYELGYCCPICKYQPMVGYNYDERLHWSEYRTFIWCEVCNRDYPSVLCMPDVETAIKIYMDCIEEICAKK